MTAIWPQTTVSAGQAKAKAVEQNQFQRKLAVSWVKLTYIMLTAGKVTYEASTSSVT